MGRHKKKQPKPKKQEPERELSPAERFSIHADLAKQRIKSEQTPPKAPAKPV